MTLRELLKMASGKAEMMGLMSGGGSSEPERIPYDPALLERLSKV